MSNNFPVENYKELVSTIIATAIQDWKREYQYLKKHSPNSRSYDDHLRKFAECDDFFKSDWFKTLTNISPEYLMEKLHKYKINIS